MTPKRKRVYLLQSILAIFGILFRRFLIGFLTGFVLIGISATVFFLSNLSMKEGDE